MTNYFTFSKTLDQYRAAIKKLNPDLPPRPKKKQTVLSSYDKQQAKLRQKQLTP